MLLSKKGSYISGLLRLHSRQRHPTTSTATSRTSKSRRRRRRGRTSGVTVRLSMPIFLLMTSKVLSIFLLAPCAAAPCASSACSSIHKHHFLPGHTLKVRCVLVQSERVEPYRDLVQSKSSSFFAQPLFPAVGDDPTALTNFGPTGPRVQHRHQFATSSPPAVRRGRRIIFLLMTSNVLSIFLLTPSTATPCASSACSFISTISF